MTEATSDAFLSGQGIPVALGQIESELIRLWGPAADRAGAADAEASNVTRVVLANLVVGSGPGCPQTLESTLDTVVARYPCRAIVLRRTDDSDRQVFAEVAALCHLPSGDRPQVCSERIILRAGPSAMGLVPGAVRPLLEANLPFVLWWPDDPSACEPLFRNLGEECSRLILDLPDPSPDLKALRLGLDPSINAYSRDTAWFAITRWRELLAQFFDGPQGARELSKIEALEVRVGVPESAAEGRPRMAAWLVAWLAGQLGWTRVSVSDEGPRHRNVVFRGPNGDVNVTMISEQVEGSNPLPQVLGMALTIGTDDGLDVLRVTRLQTDSPQVRIDRSSPVACVLPRVVSVAQVDAAGRVTAALESARQDPPYSRALPHLFWLLEDSDEPSSSGG